MLGFVRACNCVISSFKAKTRKKAKKNTNTFSSLCCSTVTGQPDDKKCESGKVCVKLNADCIDCDFNESCVYGRESTVMCRPKQGVVCLVSLEMRSDQLYLHFDFAEVMYAGCRALKSLKDLSCASIVTSRTSRTRLAPTKQVVEW